MAARVRTGWMRVLEYFGLVDPPGGIPEGVARDRLEALEAQVADMAERLERLEGRDPDRYSP